MASVPRLASRCNFIPAIGIRTAVNRRFAEKAATEAQIGDLIWVHDYHLMSVARSLRELEVKERLAYFHHIPFPSPDIFEKLPWREEILTALLDFDVVGLQTLRDRRNFIACLRQFVKRARSELKANIWLWRNLRSTFVGAFPISIDFDEFSEGAAQPDVANRAAEITDGLKGCRIILGVDRLDYTKGIPEKLAAFRHLLEWAPELHRKLTLIQVVVPSREDIPKYGELKSQIQRMVSETNGRFGEPEWVPIHYIHRSLNRPNCWLITAQPI